MGKSNILVIFVLFLFIYQPPILPVNVLHVIGGFAWIYIFFYKKNVKDMIKVKHIFLIFYFMFFLWIFTLFIIMYNNNSIRESFNLLYFVVDIIPASIMFAIYFTKKSYKVYDFFKSLLIVGSCQGLLSLIAFIIPGVKNYFISKLISYGYNDVYIALSEFRMNGFASNLTYSTPIVQSVLTVIAIYLSINKNWKYIFFTPLLFFSAIVNARISIIILLVGLLAILFNFNYLQFKKVLKIVLISIFTIVILNLGTTLLKSNNYETYNWVVEGIEEINKMFEGDSSGKYFDYYTGEDRYALPTGVNFFFGVGERIMGANSYGVRSDIGFINDIWLGGIFYVLFLYMLFGWFLYSFLKIKSSEKKLNRFIFIFFLCVFLISNIKGFIFTMNNFTNLFFLIFTFLSLRKEKINN